MDLTIYKLIDLLKYDSENPLLFNSGFFVYFFFLFMLLYYLFRNSESVRNYIFCFFSLYFFYKASGAFVILVVVSAIVDYFLSNLIFRQKVLYRRKLLLFLSIIFNMGMLTYFKYTNFFIETLNNMFSVGFNPLNILLPVGISFYTFENLSYTIDVYRGEFKPARRFIDYLLFLSFFPKLVMGPIVRAHDFVPQINKPYYVSEEDFSNGFFLIVTGLFKKLVISDYITLNFVNYIFDDPSRYSGLENLFAVYGYAIVIYCDFSGYSDTAIGLAKWLGFNIPANFKSPYKSLSITEFWHRWHISLSSWLKDYLYVPLGGNRNASLTTWVIGTLFFIGVFFVSRIAFQQDSDVSFFITAIAFSVYILPSAINPKKFKVSTNFNLLATMLLGGLWHGASWNFIIWGALHGIFLFFHKTWLGISVKGIDDAKQTVAYKLFSLLITFHIVCFCWIYFRASSMESAHVIILQICKNIKLELFIDLFKNYWKVIVMIAVGFTFHFIPDRLDYRMRTLLLGKPLVVYVIVFLFFLFTYGFFKSSEPVMPIYLQF